MCPILNSFGETRLLDQDAAPSSCSSFIDVAARSGVTYEPPPFSHSMAATFISSSSSITLKISESGIFNRQGRRVYCSLGKDL